MSRPALFLLVTVGGGKKRTPRFCWPVPLFLLPMLSDMVVDLTCFAALFVRRGRAEQSGAEKKRIGPSVRKANAWALCIHALLREVYSISGPWELVSVEAEGFRFRMNVV